MTGIPTWTVSRYGSNQTFPFKYKGGMKDGTYQYK